MKPDDHIDQIVQGILDYLKAQGDLDLLPQVSRRLAQTSAIEVDPNLAQVTSAVPLTSSQKNQLTSILSQKFNRPIKLKTKVDSKILGGLLINVAGQTIDATLTSRLTDLKTKAAYG